MQPYSSLAVRKLTRTLAIGKRDGGFMRAGESLLGGCTGNWYKLRQHQQVRSLQI